MSVETRCTQCGTENENSVPPQKLSNGSGRAHGAEEVFCKECSGSCDLDECTRGDPCERCHTKTVQNRCGKSVPAARS